jgi:DNA-binding transcriptional LysR family regulator
VGPLEWTSSWVSKALGELRWGLYARAEHPLATHPTEAEVLRFSFAAPTYLAHEEFQVGDDQCPVPLKQRILGAETATAHAAFEIVRRSDQLVYAPEIAARCGVAGGWLREIKVQTWPIVQRTLYMSVRADVVSKPLLNAFVSAFGDELAPANPSPRIEGPGISLQ